MRNWDELSELEQLATYYSDSYKDAYGIRPRGNIGHPQTVEEYKEKLDYLGGVIRSQVKEEKALDQFCINLNNKAREGKIDKLVGRKNEIGWLYSSSMG